MNNDNEYKLRLLNEYEELTIKSTKLYIWLKNPQRKDKLMSEQLKIMGEYQNILKKRILHEMGFNDD